MLLLNNSDSLSSLMYHVATRNLKEARIEIGHEKTLRSHKVINAARKGDKKTVLEILDSEGRRRKQAKLAVLKK